jgi:hypothetical protein
MRQIVLGIKTNLHLTSLQKAKLVTIIPICLKVKEESKNLSGDKIVITFASYGKHGPKPYFMFLILASCSE